MKPATLRALLEGDLANAIIAATPGGIEAQEAQGQQAFVASCTLPIRCNHCERKQFLAMGIIYGGHLDDLFVEVILPPGWQKIPTDHSMWSKLVDDQGRERASIFYKAAFYDRDAFISTTRRFSYRTEILDDDHWKTSARRCIVTDCAATIWASPPMEPSEDVPWFHLSEHLDPQGAAWLEENYPDWRDPLAYWD